MNVAFFGGSFDPPHVGHVLAASYALSIGFDKVVVSVVKSHAFAKRLTAFQTRVTMARLAFSQLSGVEVTDLEGRLPEPNYTLHTLRAIQDTHPSWRLRLLIGADVVPDFEKWFGFEELKRLAPPLTLGRVGYESPDPTTVSLPDVSSTEARHYFANRRTDGAAESWLETHVPAAVLAYVKREGLYLSG
jgi:nicotinate-nucleotide adenylyltransferase